MAVSITQILSQELERILGASDGASGAKPCDKRGTARDDEIRKVFRDSAAIRQAANDALRRYAEQMSRDELMEFQSALNARLDEWLSARITELVEWRERALTRQSERDPVTGLPNRAAFNRRLRDEIERARRYHRELSIVLFDVDRFKSVNDQFGHPAGDRILAQVAGILESSLRQSDAVFRYGGDEFAAICPETSGEAIAHALRRLESNMPAWRPESPVHERVAEHLGISWGAASFPVDAVEEDDLIGLADNRLYACKREHYRSAAAGL